MVHHDLANSLGRPSSNHLGFVFASGPFSGNLHFESFVWLDVHTARVSGCRCRPLTVYLENTSRMSRKSRKSKRGERAAETFGLSWQALLRIAPSLPETFNDVFPSSFPSLLLSECYSQYLQPIMKSASPVLQSVYLPSRVQAHRVPLNQLCRLHSWDPGVDF